MKVFVKFSLFLLLLLFLAGCKADLTVVNPGANWDDTTGPNVGNKSAKARIKNIGLKDAGMFMVYFDAEENPVSQNHRPQVSHQVDGLVKGAYIDLGANFAPLAHHDNAYLANVYKIVVIADSKGMVEELNENNNRKEIPVP